MTTTTVTKCLTDRIHTSATGRTYEIDERGIARRIDLADDYVGCECELDWNCPLHPGAYTALELANDAWAKAEPADPFDAYDWTAGGLVTDTVR